MKKRYDTDQVNIMANKKTNDWEKIKAEYITTDISLRDLADKYGIPMSCVGRRASLEKWSQERKKHKNKVVKEVVQKVQKSQANELAKKMKTVIGLRGVIDKALEDADQFSRWIISEGLGDGVSATTEKVFSKIDMKSIRDAAYALKVLQEIEDRVKGTIDAKDLKQIDIALQKLELDRERLELEKKKSAIAAAETDVTVTIEGKVKEWAE